MTKGELKTEIGQHLLVDQDVMAKVVESIPGGHTVLEVGAGPGLLTKHLVNKSKRVVSVELDTKFSDDLSALEENNQNLKVVYANALDVLAKKDFKEVISETDKVWIAGNIPYHITEPLIMRLMELPISGATFVTGAKFANEITASHESEKFGKLTLLVNTFFAVQVIDYIKKESFLPPPRTTSALVVLKPKNKKDILSQPSSYLASELFLSSHRGTLVKNLLREAIIKFTESQKMEEAGMSDKPTMKKNEAREIIAKTEISKGILEKSVEQLNNKEFGELSEMLKNLRV